MTEALMKMEDAPDENVLIWLTDNEFPSCWCMSDTRNSPFDKGFLPLPAYASSANVAKTAGKWLSVCSDEDVAAVIREALKREGVRTALETASNWPEATRHKSAAINNSFVAPVLRALIQEPTDD